MQEVARAHSAPPLRLCLKVQIQGIEIFIETLMFPSVGGSVDLFSVGLSHIPKREFLTPIGALVFHYDTTLQHSQGQ